MKSKNGETLRINSIVRLWEIVSVTVEKALLDKQYRPNDTEPSVDKNVCSYPLSQPFPYVEILIQGTFLKEGSLPAFWGPSIRGALGFHLKKTVCHVNQGSCQSCIVQKSCAYSYIFEGVANAFLSQKEASFPSYEHDGPFSELAQQIQVRQYQTLKTSLGREWFYNHRSPLIRATRGFVFLKEMELEEFYQSCRKLKSSVEAYA